MSDWAYEAAKGSAQAYRRVRYVKLYKAIALICFGILIGLLIGCAPETRASPCAGRPDAHVEIYKNEYAPGKPIGEICVPNKKADQ